MNSLDKRVSALGQVIIKCYCGSEIPLDGINQYEDNPYEMFAVCDRCKGVIMINRASIPIVDVQYDCEERKLLARKGNRKN